MPSKSVGTWNNKRLLIKLIPINLIFGNKNKMDQGLMPTIIPKGILTANQFKVIPIGPDLYQITQAIRILNQSQTIQGNILLL